MKIKRIGIRLLLLGVIFAVFVGFFQFVIPKSTVKHLINETTTEPPTQIVYVAIGDSLTEGVGDITGQGGFVPLLATGLSQTINGEVVASNFGVSGNTSQQILKRMSNDEAIRHQLAQAHLMTLTVGGNDVMAVIRQHLTKLELSQFEQARQLYQERLRRIIDLSRRENPQLPIYVLGIYNPFYLNFPEMTVLQDVVDQWNDGTKAVTETYDQVYFVPINDLLYKGVDGQGGIVSEYQGQTSVTNNALFEVDHFHPNTVGYQLMAKAVKEAIDEKQPTWPNK